MTNLPAEIQVWRGNDALYHTGTWSTERYPAEAVTYVPKADAEAARAAFAERAGALRDAAKHFTEWDHCYPGNISLELVHAHISNAVAAFDALATTDGLALVAELRAERDEAKRLMEMRHREMLAADELMRKHQRRADNAIAERDRLAADNARLAARVEAMTELIRWAHDTLWELNPSNYDHDEVCKVNDSAVEVILGLAPVIGETHGYSAEWWEARAALSPAGEAGQ